MKSAVCLLPHHHRKRGQLPLPGNVVSIEELFHAVWKDEYYSKNSSTITVHIRHLREKLKDTSDTPQYIKTIWGVGYKIDKN